MRTIHIKVIKEAKNFVTIRLPIANTRMRITKEDFKRRLERGEYTMTGANLKS